jgi:hypothetical protein
MLKDILEIADSLIKIVPKDQRKVIKVFKRCMISNQIHSARILSDEFVDHVILNDLGVDVCRVAQEMYDRTMEFYEINYQ